MAVFQDVTFEWKDEQYIVKGNQVFRLIAELEEVITIAEIVNGCQSMTKISAAYAVCLNFAGAKVSSEEVYEALFGSDSISPIEYLQSLIDIVIPPKKLQVEQKEDDSKKK